MLRLHGNFVTRFFMLIHIATFEGTSSSPNNIRQSWDQERSRIKSLEDKYRWKLIDQGVRTLIKQSLCLIFNSRDIVCQDFVS